MATWSWALLVTVYAIMTTLAIRDMVANMRRRRRFDRHMAELDQLLASMKRRDADLAEVERGDREIRALERKLYAAIRPPN